MVVKESRARKGRGGWVFLGVVALLYAVTAVLDPGLMREALAFFVQILDRVIPVLAIVFVLLFVLDLVLSPKRVRRLVGERSGMKGWVAAVAGGILSTGPIYAWYVLLGELRGKGMKTSLAAAFLCSRAVKLPLLPLLIHYFGLRYTLVLSAYLIGFAVLNGVLMGWIDRSRVYDGADDPGGVR